MSLSSLLLSLSLGLVVPQTPPQQPPAPEVRVDDVVVEGRRLEQAVENFVDEIAAPVRGRGLARWHRRVCVGVVNLDAAPAQYLVDRVSTVAQDVGLEPGEPGCKPNVVIIATNDGKGMADSLVKSRPRDFDTGASGTNLTSGALQDFRTNDRPVRWWHVSLPVNDETGLAAVRLPGRVTGAGDSLDDYAPIINTFAASRLVSQIRDDLQQVIVVIDVDDLGTADFEQVAEYVSLVALAQIDARSETRSYDTILNLFDDPSANRALTPWDLAYLKGLYTAETNRVNRAAQSDAVASSIVRDRRQATTDDQE